MFMQESSGINPELVDSHRHYEIRTSRHFDMVDVPPENLVQGSNESLNCRNVQQASSQYEDVDICNVRS